MRQNNGFKGAVLWVERNETNERSMGGKRVALHKQCVGVMLSRTRTLVSRQFRGLTIDMFQVNFVRHKYNYFAGSTLIILTWPCQCTMVGVSLVTTCDVGGLRGTHIGPSWCLLNFASCVVANVHWPHAGPKWALVEALCGKLLQVPMDPIIGNICVIHESASLWPFMGLMVFATWGSMLDHHGHW